MDPRLEHQMRLTRRQLFGLAGGGIGTAALAALLSEDLGAWPAEAPKREGGLNARVTSAGSLREKDRRVGASFIPDPREEQRHFI